MTHQSMTHQDTTHQDTTQAALRLPLKQRLKLVRQRIYAATGFRGHRPLAVRRHPLGAEIVADGASVIVPSPLRWKLYKKGWAARLDQLAREYGLDRHIDLGPDSVILDIGANAGEFAHLAARAGARIYCVEPDPRVFACLQENVKALAGASCHDALFWKEAAKLDFYSVPERADSSVFAEGEGRRIEKEAVTADAFARAQGLTRIDLVKCDAEGAEPEVLEGAREILARARLVAVDTGAERQGARTNAECARLLQDAGLRVIEETVGKRQMTYGLAPVERPREGR